MDGENVFNNSMGFAPSLEGQAEDFGTENIDDVGEQGVEPEVVTEPQEAAPQGQAVEQKPVWANEFQSADEMYAELQKSRTSYDNLRPEYTRATQELSKLRNAQQVQQQPQQYTDPSYVGNDILDKVADIVRPIKEQNDALMMQNSVAMMIKEHPDFAELAPNIQQVFENNPALWNVSDPLGMAYKIAKADQLAANIPNVVAQARENMYADKEIKVLGGSGKARTGSVSQGEKSEADTIKESILSAASGNNSIY